MTNRTELFEKLFFKKKKHFNFDISNLDISNLSVGRAKLLEPWTSSSRSLELAFKHFGQVLKFERFIRFFGKTIYHKGIYFFVRCFLEKDGACKTKTDK